MRRTLFIVGAGVGLVRFIGMGFGLLVTVVIGRMLGAEGLGIYGYSVILLTLLAVPVTNGWGTLVLRSVSQATHDQEWRPIKGLIYYGLQLATFSSLMLFVVGLAFYGIFSSSLPEFLRIPFFLGILALILFFDQLSALRLAVLRGLNHPIWGQVPEMLLRPLLIVVIFLFIASMVGPSLNVQHALWALLTASGLTALLGGLILWRKAPRELSKSSASYAFRTWLASAGLLAGTAGLVMLNAQVDILMLGILGTFEQVGVYRVAAQIALFSGFVYSAMNMVAVQHFGYLRAKGDVHQLRAAATFMARIAFLGTLPLPIFFYFFGETVLRAVFGDDFLPALEPLFWLFGVQIVSVSVGMASSLLVINGREALIFRLVAISLIVNIVLCMLLIPQFGTTGAAISNLIALGGWNIALWAKAMTQLRIDTSILSLPIRV